MTDENAFSITGEGRTGRWVVTCDHASNHVPAWVNGGDLGVPAADMCRHIAYDIGAAGVALALGEVLDAPVLCSHFSRLVIDPNRGLDDPTLIMKIYDGTIIPANHPLDAAQRAARIERLYRPYHTAYEKLLAQREQPIIVAIHSFTPQLKGRRPRPWQVGVLHANDRRLADPLINALNNLMCLCVGRNQPYNGHLVGDSIDSHALRAGHLNALIEIRNDLIADAPAQKEWADKLKLALCIAQNPDKKEGHNG